MKKLPTAEIGIFGGSGFYSFLTRDHPRDAEPLVQKINLTTPYGKPSAPVTLAKISGRKVAFLPRHGEKHQFPPHKIPFKANIEAFKMLGVKYIISPCSAGSLKKEVKPGSFVILDQFLDRTHGRDDTFYHGPEVVHIGGAKPYCPDLQKIAIKACQTLKIPVHKSGTAVVINGPRFSTTSESAYFSKLGFEVINMTQYPEVILAREKEMCFLGIALITDFDAGLAGKVKPVELKEVLEVFAKNNEKSKKLIFEIIKNLPQKVDCSCSTALTGAKI